MADWGGVLFRVNGEGGWAAYMIAPALGGLLGGGIYTACFKSARLAGVFHQFGGNSDEAASDLSCPRLADEPAFERRAEVVSDRADLAR